MMRAGTTRRKVFDWLFFSGIIASVVFVGSTALWAEEKPRDTRRAEKSKVVAERNDEEEEDSGVIEIVVRIPKPEALIFSRRMETKYRTIGYEKSFTEKIIDSAKRSPL
jgi:hypothetical protein